MDLRAAGSQERVRDLVNPGDKVMFLADCGAASWDSGQLVDNIKMIGNLCEALRAIELSHFLYLSTDAVYPYETPVIDEFSSRRARDALWGDAPRT